MLRLARRWLLPLDAVQEGVLILERVVDDPTVTVPAVELARVLDDSFRSVPELWGASMPEARARLTQSRPVFVDDTPRAAGGTMCLMTEELITVRITAPENAVSQVIGLLNSHRGVVDIIDHDPAAGVQMVGARIPEGEASGLEDDLRQHGATVALAQENG